MSKEKNKNNERSIELQKRYLSGELEAIRKIKLDAGFPNWRILRYQRIIDPEKVPFPISELRYVRPEIFEKHLKFLIKDYNVVPLSKLLQMLENNLLIPDKTVALTIDGGWVDSFIYAQPIITKYQLPVSCFIPTSCIDTDDFHWEDKVLFILLALKQNNQKIPLFDFFPKNITQSMLEISPQGEINHNILYLYILALKSLSLQERLSALIALSKHSDSFGASYPEIPNYLSWEEVKTMEKVGIVFGSNGHLANFFSDLETEAMLIDINQSFKTLKANLQNPLNIFAFPECEINENAIAATKKTDYKFFLGGDSINPLAKQEEFPRILNRVSIFQKTSANVESFFTNIWNIDLNL